MIFPLFFVLKPQSFLFFKHIVHTITFIEKYAQVAELVDALVLEASVERRVGSSPTLGTKK